MVPPFTPTRPPTPAEVSRPVAPVTFPLEEELAIVPSFSPTRPPRVDTELETLPLDVTLLIRAL